MRSLILLFVYCVVDPSFTLFGGICQRSQGSIIIDVKLPHTRLRYIIFLAGSRTEKKPKKWLLQLALLLGLYI